MTSTADAAGWLGAAALLTAYFLVSCGQLHARGRTFQLLNLAGGAGLLANGASHAAWPSAALNTVWVAIGLAALTRGRTRRARPAPCLGASRTCARRPPDRTPQ